MFRIKICGVTRAEDVRAAAAAGADAIGLNFYRASPRSIDLPRARALAGEIPEGVARVGVFVNASPEEIRRAHRALGLDWIQLHGDEPPGVVAQLHDLPVIRAFRCRDPRFAEVPAYLDQCRRLGRLPRAVLVDAFAPGTYGGTGATVAWDALADAAAGFGQLPLILAGGLRDTNVAAAIERVRPRAVDTASGVEASPGVKDAQLVERFVAQARKAFAALDAGDHRPDAGRA